MPWRLSKFADDDLAQIGNKVCKFTRSRMQRRGLIYLFLLIFAPLSAFPISSAPDPQPPCLSAQLNLLAEFNPHLSHPNRRSGMILNSQPFFFSRTAHDYSKQSDCVGNRTDSTWGPFSQQLLHLEYTSRLYRSKPCSFSSEPAECGCGGMNFLLIHFTSVGSTGPKGMYEHSTACNCAMHMSRDVDPVFCHQDFIKSISLHRFCRGV